MNNSEVIHRLLGRTITGVVMMANGRKTTECRVTLDDGSQLRMRAVGCDGEVIDDGEHIPCDPELAIEPS